MYKLAEQVQSPARALAIPRNSIEHVFPENAEDAEWPDRDELEPYVWHIGNLTILEPRLNRRAGNSEYDAKKGIFETSEVLMTKNIPAEYNEWNRDQIIRRAKNLLPVIKEVWRVS